MRAIDIVADEDVIRSAVPQSFRERFLGLRRRQGPMLFRGTSVHGFGMDRTLTVVAIGSDGRVIAVHTMRAGGLVFVNGARWMLELESDATPPAVGTVVHFYSRSHDRTTRGVRNPDRKPRRHLRASRRNAD